MSAESQSPNLVLGQKIENTDGILEDNSDVYVREIKKSGAIIIGNLTPELDNVYRGMLRSALQELGPAKFKKKVERAKHGGTDREFLTNAMEKMVRRSVNRQIRKSDISAEDKQELAQFTEPGVFILKSALYNGKVSRLLESNEFFSKDYKLDGEIIGQRMCPAIAFSRVIIRQALPLLPTS